jgi:hypothetical protein
MAGTALISRAVLTGVFGARSTTILFILSMTQLDRFGIYGGLNLTDQEKADLRTALLNREIDYLETATDDDTDDSVSDGTPEKE